MGFFSTLEKRASHIDSLLCIGLDPHLEELASPTAEAAYEFCQRLIEATAEFALAFKPNIAFFEVFGGEGIAALERVIKSVPEGIPVILDAKRGDIASTAEAYARSAFVKLGADAVTLSPYLGYDSIEPFLKDPSKGVFLLCKTSNPGSADLQDIAIHVEGKDGFQTVYEHVSRLAREWNRKDNLGLVVGATFPDALTRVRGWAPDLWILSPGVGTQGGDLHAMLQAGLRPDGLGLLVPVSRQISRADSPRQAAVELRATINRTRDEVHGFRTSQQPYALYQQLASLADALLSAGCVRFGDFTLKSGLKSPIYIDMRRLTGYPDLLSRVAAAYEPMLQHLTFDRLAAIPYAALPIATAISVKRGWSLIYPRKETKGYGTKAEVEGVFNPGERVVVIDDLATTGGSKFEAIKKLEAVDLRVEDVVVLIDRQSGGKEALAKAGYRLHAVFSLTQLLDYWESRGTVGEDEIQAARAFIYGDTPGD